MILDLHTLKLVLWPQARDAPSSSSSDGFGLFAHHISPMAAVV